MNDEVEKLRKQHAVLQDELSRLEKIWLEKKSLAEEARQKRVSLENDYRDIINSRAYKLMKTSTKWKSFTKESVAYVLGKRDKRQLYSKVYKQKKASNILKNDKYRLYTLGFTEKSLEKLESIYRDTDNRNLKQAVAWELALWHANKYTVMDSAIALGYFDSLEDFSDMNQQRKAIIIKAECLLLCNQVEQAHDDLTNMLSKQTHPDIYFGLVNLETDTTEKLKWVNMALGHYDLQPVGLSQKSQSNLYDNLYTITSKPEHKNGPTVSVIIPAYNAEEGIQIAIESILSQTWQNLEVIVVDDCSKDATVKVVQSYMKKDPRIKLLSTGKNSGPYIARNIGLMEATGEFVTVNDSDDWSHAEKIERQAQHLMENKSFVANTSEHTRITEDIQFYRRGTPGQYIFSNMSSLMFRREPILEKLGAWDSVRFAADSEFKQRILKVFGEGSIADLKTGPLSFARQSTGSLTSSSAFGYNGFLMGIRKEYREAYQDYHQKANTLYYNFPMKNRLFTVPEPLKINMEPKQIGKRHLDIVIAADFRITGEILDSVKQEIKIHKERGLLTGLMQLNQYDFTSQKEVNTHIRDIINGKDVQFLVYGEKIQCDILLVKDPVILNEKQKYLPKIEANSVQVVIYQAPIQNNKLRYNLRRCSKHLVEYFGNPGKWYPTNQQIRETLKSQAKTELKYIKLSKENWNTNDKSYYNRLDDWIVEENPFHLENGKGDGSDEQI
ncbi:glycosyltransferase [Paucisalibacillus sp. EB02]|uniref:glycosyltransferase family 2 protein n=1 Tax=Paucisalibacillus sp. EB02 TaxID=1347087 RepID=UPI0004ACAB05|nr:glycosyltransferase [Paucisalibacillus sp. EB02]